MSILPTALQVTAGANNINAAQAHMIPRTVHVLTRAEFVAAVAAQRGFIADLGLNGWIQGERVQIVGEAGERIWTAGGAGTASHARLVEFPNGAQILLSSDDNTVTRTSGAPSGSSTTSGDKRWDQATGLVYTWTSSWDAGVLLPGTPTAAPGGPGGATVIPFDTVLKFDADYDMGVKFVAGATTMTANMSGAIVGKRTRITFVGNAANVPAMPAGAVEAASSFSYDNSVAGYRNWLEVWYDGTGLAYQWAQPVVQTVIANSAQPGFSSQPAITGTPVEGVAAAYTAGGVTGTPTPTSAFEFLLDDVSVGATFTPATADIGKGLAVRQTLTNTNGTAAATSAPKVIVAAGGGTGDADFDSWLARLTAAGGDASTTEKNAVQAFIGTAKNGATPFWDVLYRANAFVNNAAGSLVPFKKQSGAADDTSPATTVANPGGRGNISGTGYINTQTPPPGADGGLSVYLRDLQSFNPAAANVLLGCRDAGNGQNFRIGANLNGNDGQAVAGYVNGAWGGAAAPQATANTGAAMQVGHWHVQRSGASSLKLRRNGSLVNEMTTGTTAVPVSEPIYVFAQNSGGTAGAFTKAPTSIGYYGILSGSMTDAQAAAYNAAVVAMMTALGRNL